jgi:hypothetical protein
MAGLLTGNIVVTPSGGGGTAAIDAVTNISTSGSGTNITTLSYTHTVGAGLTNSYVIVVVSVNDQNNPSATATVTFGGTSMTALTSTNGVLPNNTAGTGRVYLFGLLSPTAGANTVLITTSAPVVDSSLGTIIGGSISFSHVNQSTPTGTLATNTGSGTAPATGSITSQSNDIVVGFAGVGSAMSAWPATDKTHLNVNGNSGCGNVGMSTAPGAATVTFTWTSLSDFWATAGISVHHD